MSDFEINSLEEYDQEVRSKKKKNKKGNYQFTLFLLFVFLLLLGLVVYLALPLFQEKQQEKWTPVDIHQGSVQDLYTYVTYGTRSVRNDKSIFNQKVDINSFTDTEKYYYAFQFVSEEDFIGTKEVDDDHNPVYFLPVDVVEKSIKLFFGPNVTYSTIINFNYVFPFQVYHHNVANFVYNPDKNGYDATFTQYLGEEKEELPEYYTQLDSAYENENGDVILFERVIYLELFPNGKNYDVLYYKDYNHAFLLGQDYNLSLEQIKESWKQIEGCSYIEYRFALNNSYYYFVSSEIKDKNNP